MKSSLSIFPVLGKEFFNKIFVFTKKALCLHPHLGNFNSKQSAYRKNFYFSLKSSLNPKFVFIYPITIKNRRSL